MKFKEELLLLKKETGKLNKKIVIIFLSIAVLQTISWYFTSRRFFRTNFFNDFQFDPNVYLYEYYFWFFGDLITFFLIPLLIIKFIFKENLKGYGLSFGDYKTGLILSAAFFIFMLIIVWFASALPDFVNNYPHLPSAKANWNTFFLFEAGLFLYMFSWEFIWRGFTLFGLEEKFGGYAVLIQMIPFIILHNGKPVLETFGAIAAGIALGILALRTRSILYGLAAHAGVIFSLDLISVLRYRTGEYGFGFSALINIFSEIF